MNFSDFPYPDDWPHFLPQFKVKEYLENYADNFNLSQHIHFNHEVIEITRLDKSQPKGSWMVRVKNEGSDEVKVEKFDAVMVCAGLHKKGVIPQVWFQMMKDM